MPPKSINSQSILKKRSFVLGPFSTSAHEHVLVPDGRQKTVITYGLGLRQFPFRVPVKDQIILVHFSCSEFPGIMLHVHHPEIPGVLHQTNGL